jgi:chemotaxis methyl-accepting protein methylase
LTYGDKYCILNYMSEVFGPDYSIGVYNPTVVGEPLHVTEIFRYPYFLFRLMSLAASRQQPEQQFRAVSLGCSVGAEVDSILAFGNQLGIRSMKVTGVDISDSVLDVARKGEYAALLPVRPTDERVRSLRNYGFEVQWGTDHWDEGYSHTVRATELRKGHDVDFVNHDISQDGPLEGEEKSVDLITAHTMFQYVPEERRSRFTQAVIAMARTEGIISLGPARLYVGGHESTPEDLHGYSFDEERAFPQAGYNRMQLQEYL